MTEKNETAKDTRPAPNRLHVARLGTSGFVRTIHLTKVSPRASDNRQRSTTRNVASLEACVYRPNREGA
jgi:hypothetical protein